jgi:hypothetical protein
MPTGSLFTISPTATSSLLSGSGTYSFLGPQCGAAVDFFCFIEFGGLISRGGMNDDNEFLGARDQDDRVVEDADALDDRAAERDKIETSDMVGETARLDRLLGV